MQKSVVACATERLSSTIMDLLIGRQVIIFTHTFVRAIDTPFLLIRVSINGAAIGSSSSVLVEGVVMNFYGRVETDQSIYQKTPNL